MNNYINYFFSFTSIYTLQKIRVYEVSYEVFNRVLFLGRQNVEKWTNEIAGFDFKVCV